MARSARAVPSEGGGIDDPLAADEIRRRPGGASASRMSACCAARVASSTTLTCTASSMPYSRASSPHAHAFIRSIETGAAEDAPGVVAVYTGKDYVADRLGQPKAMMPRKKADWLAAVRAAAPGAGDGSRALCR